MVLCEDIPLCDALNLALPYPMHRLIALEGPPSGTERAKLQAWIDAAFDKTMILFDYVV